jgi:hypothetical protein
MQFIDVLSFCFSILGLYGLFFYLRFLIPRNFLPYVSALLTEAKHLLDRAESTGVIPRPNDYRPALTSYVRSPLCPLPGDHVTSPIDVVAPVNSCRFGRKAIERPEYSGNSDLLV